MAEYAVISGGAGFLGSHLTDLFLARGYRVVVIDNLLTGSRRNLAHLAGDDRLLFLEQNCADPVLLELPVRFVLHFACPASPADYFQYPLETLEAGSTGTLRMLELVRAHDARFILASTSEIYGDPLEHPQKESYFGNVNSIGPRSVYDEAKRFAEALTMAFHRRHGVNTGMVRIFNTYGPRMRLNDGRAIPNFVYQALTGQPLTVYGNTTRSFCYVSDLVEGIFRLAQCDFHEPVNLGNPREYTIRELAERVQTAIGSTCPIVVQPALEDDPKVRRPDITRARTLLGWEPTVELDEGLQTTIAAFRHQLGCGVA